jgi:hypothetical protein
MINLVKGDNESAVLIILNVFVKAVLQNDKYRKGS